MLKPTCCVFLFLLLLALPGCAHVSEEAGTKTFAYDWWLPPLMFLGGLAAGPVGWKMRENRFGKLLIIVCPFLALFMAPHFYLTRATVTEEGFTATAGVWGHIDIEAKFDEITHAQLTAQGRKNDHYWTFSRRSAEDVQLSIGDVVGEQAALEIVARLKARGIETKDDPGGP